MKVIVTGATGFIGSNLARALVAKGHEVIAVARQVPDTKTAAEWIPGDLAAPDWDPVASLPQTADAIVHLAQSSAYREFPEAAPDIFAVNTAATFKLLHYARSVGASHFIHASSGSVYTGMSGMPLSETEAISPASFSGHALGFYCATKLCGETLVESYRPQIASVSSLRIFAPYGPSGDASLVNRLVNRVAAGEKIQSQGNPGLTFNPIHVEDICRIIDTLLQNGESVGALNVAGGEVVSLTDLVKLAGEITGHPPEIEYSEADPPEGAKLIADTGRLESLTGEWRFSLEEGIRSLLC